MLQNVSKNKKNIEKYFLKTQSFKNVLQPSAKWQLLNCALFDCCRRRDPVIIDDDDEYSLHHHHHHHQLPAAYLQLAGKTGTADDSPPLSPTDGRTFSDAGTFTTGCTYCAATTPGVASDCTGDVATSAGNSEGGDGLGATCARCGHHHHVHLYSHNNMNSTDYVTNQTLHHWHNQQQQQDAI